MEKTFFFQTQQIHDKKNIFDQFKKQKIFYSYFQVDQNYYLFVYSQKSIDISSFYHSFDVIEELDSKLRKLRSLRGFFLYALEIIENGENYEILQTNLQPFFWKKVKNIIRQNRKSALQEFLFGKDTDTNHDTTGSNPALQELQNQVDSLAQQVKKLQQKVIQLEARVEQNSKDLLSEPLNAPNDIKITQHPFGLLRQKDYTFEVEKGPYLTENDPKRSSVLSEVRNPTSQTKNIQSKSLSEQSKIDFKASETSE